MNLTKQQYQRMLERESPDSHALANCCKAFVVGGAICTLAQVISNFYENMMHFTHADSGTWTSITLIILSGLLTCLHLYEKIAKHGGAGTLVPITGFANSIVSPAIEFKSEGYVLGLGAKMFIIAGPVLVYGISASFIYGIYLYLTGGGF